MIVIIVIIIIIYFYDPLIHRPNYADFVS